VTYVDKKGVRSTLYLSECAATNEELIHRLKYLKDCVHQFIQAKLAGADSTELNVALLNP